MSRFYYTWWGNKRTEIKHIDEFVNYDDYETIVEPFCGSSALSLELYARGLKKRYILNDTDANLINLMKQIKTEKTSEGLYQYCRDRLTVEDWNEHKEKWKSANKTICEPMNTYEYFYSMRVRGSFGRNSAVPAKWPSLKRNKKIEMTDSTLSDDNTIITLGDWRLCVDKYKDDPKALIFLDPPYFSSFNQEYYGMRDGVELDGKAKDSTMIFIEIFEYLKSSKAKIVFITNSCSLIDYLFNDYIEKRYIKNYSNTLTRDCKTFKKYTDHILIIGGNIGNE